ncbi:basic salivary proline-rich protein 1-like, partial [Lontra canadensis]|uniref:basic salivary proline-rich protein 1-like n=1 Tax=Lontra canadensis TaxID=76717 RepID=UPI0013F2E518
SASFPSGPPDPADPLSRRELGRPENEGRQRRGAAGSSPTGEFQGAESGVPPRPRHNCGTRGTPEAPPPHKPEGEAETPPGTVTAALILPPPPGASPPRTHRAHLAGDAGRGGSGHGPRPRGSQSRCGSSRGLPAPLPRPARRQGPCPAPRPGPASPPRRPSAHLGLDDAREEAQGDQQLHCGRPPHGAGPPGPRLMLTSPHSATSWAPGAGERWAARATTQAASEAGEPGAPTSSPRLPRPRLPLRPGHAPADRGAWWELWFLRGCGPTSCGGAGPAAGVARELRRRRPLRLPHGGQWYRTTRASKTRSAAGGTPPPSAGRRANPSRVMASGIPAGAEAWVAGPRRRTAGGLRDAPRGAFDCRPGALCVSCGGRNLRGQLGPR